MFKPELKAQSMFVISETEDEEGTINGEEETDVLLWEDEVGGSGAGTKVGGVDGPVARARVEWVRVDAIDGINGSTAGDEE
jgi:hypothetical protein